MEKLFAFIKSIYIKYREIISYIITGVLTTLVSWGSYALFYYAIGTSNTWANIISWILAVTFAFIVNKFWVFSSKSTDETILLKEMVSFYGARILTGILETGSMYLFVDILGFHAMLMKIIISIIVTLLNYFISKFLVFKNK